MKYKYFRFPEFMVTQNGLEGTIREILTENIPNVNKFKYRKHNDQEHSLSWHIIGNYSTLKLKDSKMSVTEMPYCIQRIPH